MEPDRKPGPTERRVIRNEKRLERIVLIIVAVIAFCIGAAAEEITRAVFDRRDWHSFLKVLPAPKESEAIATVVVARSTLCYVPCGEECWLIFRANKGVCKNEEIKP